MGCQSLLGEAPLLNAQSFNSAYRQQFRQVLLESCPRGGTALETGIGAAYETFWLSLRGVNAIGIDSVQEIAERANQLASRTGSHCVRMRIRSMSPRLPVVLPVLGSRGISCARCEL